MLCSIRSNFQLIVNLPFFALGFKIMPRFLGIWPCLKHILHGIFFSYHFRQEVHIQSLCQDLKEKESGYLIFNVRRLPRNRYYFLYQFLLCIFQEFCFVFTLTTGLGFSPSKGPPETGSRKIFIIFPFQVGGIYSLFKYEEFIALSPI